MAQMAQPFLPTDDLANLESPQHHGGRPEESLDWITRFDPITHLLNREVFDLRLRETLAEQDPAPAAAVVAFKLQRFALIKAMHGFSTGNRLLRLVAGRVAGLAAPGETVARSRDDVFLLLIPTSDPQRLDRAVSRFATAFREPFDLGPEKTYVDASFGVARAPHDARSSSSLVGSALTALHHAHHVLLTSVCYFEPSMRTRAIPRASTSTGHADAWSADQLVVEYQPQVNLDSGKMVSVEALVRWTSTSQGLPLDSFRRFADYLRAHESWTETILRQACGGVAECVHQPGALYDRVPVAVKVDVEELMIETLTERIRQCLEAAQLEPQSLVLELPDEFRARDLPYCFSNLRELRSLGVQICLADCCSSARCLALLSRFQFDRVHLEKHLVSKIGAQNGDTTALAAVIVGLAETFGAECCAEGVETAAQAETLRHIGCRAGQGPLFSEPVSKEHLARLLAGAGSPRAQAEPSRLN